MYYSIQGRGFSLSANETRTFVPSILGLVGQTGGTCVCFGEQSGHSFCIAKFKELANYIMLVSVLLMIALASAEPLVYFREQFEDGDAWNTRWVESSHRSDYGKFVLTAGKFYGDAEKDKGLQTSQDAHFYSSSARFEPFSNQGKTLVIQFTVKHEQNMDCGGGYIKLFPADLDQADMHGDSNYNIMFGPDICGPATKKVHVIINYKGKNHLIRKDIRCKDDEYTHLYTLILNPDDTYEVKIDNKKVESGSLEEDWDILPPKKVKDPEAVKPDDWDERERVEDPDDKKPEDWDRPENIADPDAKKPEDWDDEMDGEWEPPMVSNPDYKGEWKPRKIDNPDYKGKWVHPEIDNPDYSADSEIYRFDSIGVIGLDLWQVKSGTIFDNFLITDDATLAKEVGNETWGQTKDPEKKMKESQEEKERKKLEAEEMARKEEKEVEELEHEEEEEVEELEHEEEEVEELEHEKEEEEETGAQEEEEETDSIKDEL